MDKANRIGEALRSFFSAQKCSVLHLRNLVTARTPHINEPSSSVPVRAVQVRFAAVQKAAIDGNHALASLRRGGATLRNSVLAMNAEALLFIQKCWTHRRHMIRFQ